LFGFGGISLRDLFGVWRVGVAVFLWFLFDLLPTGKLLLLGQRL
jgi:hypothetical protein